MEQRDEEDNVEYEYTVENEDEIEQENDENEYQIEPDNDDQYEIQEYDFEIASSVGPVKHQLTPMEVNEMQRRVSNLEMERRYSNLENQRKASRLELPKNGSQLELERKNTKLQLQSITENPIQEIDKSERKKLKRAKKLEFQQAVKMSKIFLAVIVALVVALVITVIILAVGYNQKQLIVPTTARSTTTKANKRGEFSIGQYCLYNNQCPRYAFCIGTCQCPQHYYQDKVNGSCMMTKSNGANCNDDDECNKFVGLKCSTTCQCDTAIQYWNSTYVNGGSLPNGRCQNRKVLGSYCPASNEGFTGTSYTSSFNSQVQRCWCNQGYYSGYFYNLAEGRCQYMYPNPSGLCNSNVECYNGNSMCMDTNGDGIYRCIPLPIRYWYSSYQTKMTYGNGGCTATTYKCNEWANLVCRQSTCLCYDEYYYWNNTMCVYGSRYGEPCNVASQCTPSTAGFVCDYPYTGALNTVCRCAIGTKYYDLTTKTCQNLKSINATCRDSKECSGSASNLMFCGSYEGGTQRVCQCVDGYYWNGANCVIKIAYNVGCTYSYQCNDHLNQTCLSSTGRCGCSTGQYYSTTDYTCQYKKYKGDSCSVAAECWSGTCTSSKCT